VVRTDGPRRKKPVPGSQSVGTIEKADAGRAGSVKKNRRKRPL